MIRKTIILLNHYKKWTLQDIEKVVADNDKKRFTLTEIEGKMYIKANQGHSIAVQDLELKKITDASLYPVVVHGTYLKHWNNIKKSGLNKMTRNHIHLATGEFGSKSVISGKLY